VSGSGISWAICKSAPRSKQITRPAPHHCFYRPPNQQRQSTEGNRTKQMPPAVKSFLQVWYVGYFGSGLKISKRLSFYIKGRPHQWQLSVLLASVASLLSHYHMLTRISCSVKLKLVKIFAGVLCLHGLCSNSYKMYPTVGMFRCSTTKYHVSWFICFQ